MKLLFDCLILVLSTFNKPFSKCSENMKFYPNPAKDHILIEPNNSKLIKATIYDLNGKRLKASNNQKVDVSNLESGAYIISVVTDYGRSNHKVIKRYSHSEILSLRFFPAFTFLFGSFLSGFKVLCFPNFS